MVGNNSIVIRQQAGALMTEAENLLKIMGQRSLTSWEEKRVDEITAKVEALLKDADQLDEREGYRGVAKPQGLQRSGGSTSYRSRTQDQPTAITARFIRTGDVIAGQEMHAAAVDEIRASNDSSWNITTNADGGYLVPTGHFQGIIARRDELILAPRLGVRRIPGTAQTVNVPVDAEADGEFVTTSEQNDAHANNYDRDQAALNTVAMTLSKKTKKIELTEELIQSEDSQLMPFIEDWVGRGFARTHNSMLLTEVLSGGTAALTLDAAAAIGATEVPELAYLLAEEYADGAAWVMRRATESFIRSIASSSMFTFAGNPAGNDQARRDLWGHPLYASQYAGALQASGKSLVFGNFNFVGMREAPTLSLLRDPYSVDGMLVLKYSFRSCYKVLQSEAVLYATHPTA